MTDRPNLRLAPFRFDVTPPPGHPLCGGWLKPVVAVDDSLEAVGFVLLGAGRPIVICAVDWTGLLNEAHLEWRQAFAEAAGTTPERVAIQCVHQHNTPFACLEADRIVRTEGDLSSMMDPDFHRLCLDRGREAVRGAMAKVRPVTHVAHGQAEVREVASNRRVFRDEKERVIANRHSMEPDVEMRALPEGLIDPWLKTVAFYERGTKIAACHYYATHPMSYYGDGRVSGDIPGLARKRRQADEPACAHLYFTGCAGNIAAGKYNDGSPKMRAVLTQRVYDGIVRSEENLRPVPVESVSWRTLDFLPAPLPAFSEKALQSQVSDRRLEASDRGQAAYKLSWLRRMEKKTPIVLSALRINDIVLLHLPAECFIEYQLRAQQFQPCLFVATAAYGDGGPWYIPVKEEYFNGGYEVSVAFCDPKIDRLLTEGIQRLLVPEGTGDITVGTDRIDRSNGSTIDNKKRAVKTDAKIGDK